MGYNRGISIGIEFLFLLEFVVAEKKSFSTVPVFVADVVFLFCTSL